mgnify:FL=1
MKKTELLNQHTSPITLLPSGYYYTRLGGRKIQRRNKKDIEEEIVKYYDSRYKTLRTIYPEYLESRKIEVANTTWKKDVYNFNTYIKNSKLGDTPLPNISLEDGYTFLNHCKSLYPSMKRKYWHCIRGTLNSMFQYAIDRLYISNNPIHNLKPKKDFFAPATKTKDSDTVFSQSEMVAVTQLAEKDCESTGKAEPLGIIVLFNLGLRDGELCALKWCDIEFYRGKAYIHIQREMVAHIDDTGAAHGFEVLSHCKSEAGDRRIQLNDKAIDTFNKIKRLNTANSLPTTDDDYIFLRHHKGEIKFCTPRSFDPRLRKYCRQAGMTVIKSPHDIRRTVLTNLYNVGMPLKKIQVYAGHSTLQQTMDYIRISEDDLDMLRYLNTLSDNSNIISINRDKIPLNTVEHPFLDKRKAGNP